MITHYLHGQWNMLNLSVSVSVSVSLSPLNPTRLLKTDGERRCRREKKRKEEAKEIEERFKGGEGGSLQKWERRDYGSECVDAVCSVSVLMEVVVGEVRT